MTDMRLIDAYALYRRIVAEENEIITDNDHAIGLHNGLTLAQAMVINAPVIDCESLRPVGEWVMRGGKRYCTNCGARACVTRDREDFWYTVGTPFCPNCGARMKGEGKP